MGGCSRMKVFFIHLSTKFPRSNMGRCVTTRKTDVMWIKRHSASHLNSCNRCPRSETVPHGLPLRRKQEFIVLPPQLQNALIIQFPRGSSREGVPVARDFLHVLPSSLQRFPQLLNPQNPDLFTLKPASSNTRIAETTVEGQKAEVWGFGCFGCFWVFR